MRVLPQCGYARLGDNCRVRDGVVVELRRIEEQCTTVICSNFAIGSGAIRTDNNVLAGANAAMLCDVADNSIAVREDPSVVRSHRLRAGQPSSMTDFTEL